MKFKNAQDYLEQREALMATAEKAINEGNAEKANETMEEVKKLDAAFDEWKIAQANLQALSNETRVPAGQIPKENGTVSMEGRSAQKKEFDKGSEEYKDAWLNVVRGIKLSDSEQKIVDAVNAGTKMNMETAAGHTLIVPTTVRKGIWTVAAQEHPVIADLLATKVNGDLTIIIDTSDDSDADWVDEETSSTDGAFTEGEINLTGCELAKSVTISWKLKKMNGQDYEDYLIQKLGEKVGNAIANSLFTGKGKPSADDTFKPQARGIVTALEAEEGTPRIVNYTTNITYSNMTSLFALIKAAYLTGASVYAKSNTIWNQLANIVDGQKRPIFVPDVSAGGVGRIFGVPVKAEDGVPEGAVALGNFRKGYAFNFNEEMAIYQEDHVKARTTDYMAYGIADGDMVTSEAFGLLEPTSAS